eukprot:355151-Chlamydomonas_euryale.AAC.5
MALTAHALQWSARAGWFVVLLLGWHAWLRWRAKVRPGALSWRAVCPWDGKGLMWPWRALPKSSREAWALCSLGDECVAALCWCLMRRRLACVLGNKNGERS